MVSRHSRLSSWYRADRLTAGSCWLSEFAAQRCRSSSDKANIMMQVAFVGAIVGAILGAIVAPLSLVIMRIAVRAAGGVARGQVREVQAPRPGRACPRARRDVDAARRGRQWAVGHRRWRAARRCAGGGGAPSSRASSMARTCRWGQTRAAHSSREHWTSLRWRRRRRCPAAPPQEQREEVRRVRQGMRQHNDLVQRVLLGVPAGDNALPQHLHGLRVRCREGALPAHNLGAQADRRATGPR